MKPLKMFIICLGSQIQVTTSQDSCGSIVKEIMDYDGSQDVGIRESFQEKYGIGEVLKDLVLITKEMLERLIRLRGLP